MVLFSRRDVISSALAASGTALFLSERFLFSEKLADSETQSASVSVGGQVERLKNVYYSEDGQKAILDFARNTLIELFAGKTLSELRSDPDRLAFPLAERVNITLRHEGRVRGSMSAPGANLGRQIIESVYGVAMDYSNDGPLTKGEASDAILEVWIQTGSSEVGHDPRLEEDNFLPGIDGLEIESSGRAAYCLPSVPITSKYKTYSRLLQGLCLKAGLEENAWLRPDVIIRKTRWVCLPSVTNVHFFGPRSDASAQLPIHVNSCIDDSASYLIRHQEANGLTAYLYDPITDLLVGNRTNLVRSAGCLFALSQVLESNRPISQDAVFKACTIKMARSLLGLTSLTGDDTRTLQDEEGMGFPEDERIGELIGDEGPNRETPQKENVAKPTASIGATALLAAALGSGILRKEFPREYHQLYRSIASAQKPDGRFLTHFGEAEENERLANFYPGEVLLVLALEAERKNLEALEMCQRSFGPYALQFRRSPTSAFTVWHINVWSRIALLTGKHEYADFAFEQADWLMQLQIKAHRDPRWVGGFSQSGAEPQIYSAAFTEAIVRAFDLAVRTGDSERARKYADCIRSGLQFCARLRIEETQATMLAHPSRCIGGIAFGLTDRRIRCDSVQHFLTLCLVVEQTKSAYYKVLMNAG